MSNLDSKYIINLDLMQDTKNNTMHFNLSDSETSDFWINITRYGVDINEELLDKTVTLYVVKPNKNVEFGNISYDSTEKMYYCNLSSEFKNIKGNYTAQVVIYDSSTKERKVTRSKFKYYVEDDILSDASGTVKPEEQENILDDIISRLAALEEGGDGTNATASNISITDTGNYFTNSDVEGALQEAGSRIKDIANNFKLVSGDNNTIKLMFGTKELSSVTINGGTVEPTPTTYSIINTLSNATNSNSATFVEENSSYSANISANSGYKLKTVTVTMGGVDITNTVYSSGVITISSVTGNIIITVITEVDTDVVVGSIDSNNNINLTNLSAGTYTLKYEDNNGILEDFDVITTMEV